MCLVATGIYNLFIFISQTACLGPPEFNISACSNCVNVTVKILSSILKIYKKVDYTIKVKSVDSEKLVSGLLIIFKNTYMQPFPEQLRIQG